MGGSTCFTEIMTIDKLIACVWMHRICDDEQREAKIVIHWSYENHFFDKYM